MQTCSEHKAMCSSFSTLTELARTNTAKACKYSEFLQWPGYLQLSQSLRAAAECWHVRQSFHSTMGNERHKHNVTVCLGFLDRRPAWLNDQKDACFCS